MAQESLFPDFNPVPKLSLSEIETYLDRTRAFGETPSRQTLINWCEEGRLSGTHIPGLGWRVRMDSFRSLLESVEEQAA